MKEMLIFILFASSASVLDAKRILLLPAMTSSHLLQLGSVGHGLVQRGHEVHMVVHSGMKVPGNIIKWGVKVIKYQTDKETLRMESADFQLGAVNAAKSNSFPLAIIYGIVTSITEECLKFVAHEDLLKKLSALKFSFAVVDGSPLSSCNFVLPYKLGIPYGSVSPIMPFDMFSLSLQIPLLSPVQVSTKFSMTSSFAQRLQTTIAYVVMRGVIGFVVDQQAFKNTCEKPFDSLSSLAYESKIWLIDLDDLVDVPRHMPPNMINVGGISTSPPLPLEKEFKEFADSATDGLVVMTFGGTIGFLPEEYVNRIVKGVEKVKYKVVFRQKTKPTVKVPSNLKIVEWMPQNDLLAHPNTKVFVTHCGSNGQHEAVYHGVPMLGLPVHGDQIYNADRFTSKGYGKYLNIASFTPKELADAINDVATNPTFRSTIKKASAVFRSRPMAPRERAAYWVEHVMEFGSDHLQSYASQLQWYQILLLDVIFFIFGVLLLVTIISYKCARFFCRVCCGKSRPKQKTN